MGNPIDARRYEFQGARRTAAELAALPDCRVGLQTLRARLHLLGWDVLRALSTAPDPRCRRGGRRKVGGARPVPPMKYRASDGRAYARWKSGGVSHDRTFGPWDSPESTAAYSRFAAEWVAGSAVAVAKGTAITVGEMLVAWRDWAATEYRKGGKLTGEYKKVARVARAANDLYGPEPAAEFTPAALRAVRATLVSSGLSRVTISNYTGCLVRGFAWAAGQSLVPAAVADALRHVERLKPGRTTAREPVPRREVEPDRVAAILPHLSPIPARCAVLSAMVRFQALTGARPNEVCALRPCDLDRTGTTWLYLVSLAANKGATHGKARRVWIGPGAQAILLPYLDATDSAARVWPVSRAYYSVCVRRACKLAGVPGWTPHQLRHAHATRIARVTGSAQSAADAIGDTVAVASKHYIHCDPREEARRKLAADHG